MRPPPMNWEALITTLELASVTSVILMVIALPLSYWFAFSEWRWKFLLEAVVALPLVLPPTVLGFYVLIALGPQSPLGRFGLAFTFNGLVLASVLYSLPFAVQPIAAAFGAVERKYIVASWVLGVLKSVCALRPLFVSLTAHLLQFFSGLQAQEKQLSCDVLQGWRSSMRAASCSTGKIGRMSGHKEDRLDFSFRITPYSRIFAFPKTLDTLPSIRRSP